MRILLCSLALLTLASCQSFGKERIVFVPPKVDCAANDVPRVAPPDFPAVQTIPAWQLYGFGWQAVAEDVLNQRVDTANCLAQLRKQGIIK